MRRFAIAVALLAAGCGGSDAGSPRDAVLRVLVPRSARDVCAQFTDAYRRKVDAQYGPCLDIMRTQPKATRIRFTSQHVTGDHASIRVAYDFRGRRLRELYSLVRRDGRWRVSDTRLLH
jgi:hypothetical protein